MDPFSGLQSTLFYFIPVDSSGLRQNHHVTICDISGIRSSPLDSSESSGFQRNMWGSVKYWEIQGKQSLWGKLYGTTSKTSRREEMYEVETILNHRKIGRGYQYSSNGGVILSPMHHGNRNMHFLMMATH